MSITVRELIDVLKAIPGDKKLNIIYAGIDDRSIGCITETKDYVYLCDNDSEIGSNETVLWVDTSPRR